MVSLKTNLKTFETTNKVWC